VTGRHGGIIIGWGGDRFYINIRLGCFVIATCYVVEHRGEL